MNLILPAFHQDTIEVNGDQADPLYKFLKATQPRAVPGSRFALNAEIGWNYEKVSYHCMTSCETHR